METKNKKLDKFGKKVLAEVAKDKKGVEYCINTLLKINNVEKIISGMKPGEVINLNNKWEDFPIEAQYKILDSVMYACAKTYQGMAYRERIALMKETDILSKPN